jgi:RNA polymerase sigma-70 factor, ECF subfamily
MSAEVRLTDEQLVSLSKDGNLGAFNSLVHRYQSPVFTLCLRLIGNREAAEDAAQETFLSAYRALPKFAGQNFRAWLLRIAANQSKDEWRRRKRKDQAASLDEIFDHIDSPVEVADDSPGADRLLEMKEIGEIMQRALLQLPFDQRQAVLLVDIHDYHYEEVAAMTGASLGTVKSRVHRGRERLRQVLAARPELLSAYRRLDTQEGST